MSPSGGSISAQSSQAAGSDRAQQAPPHKLASAATSKPAATPATRLHPHTEAATAGPNLTIDVGSGQHPISPYVYGIDYDQNQIPAINPSIIRWGGDATSQYNWQAGQQLGFTNAGADYYFINSPQNPSSSPPDFDTFFATNHAAGVQTIGTIPINGWVAKDSTSCAFSVTKYGAQQQSIRIQRRDLRKRDSSRWESGVAGEDDRSDRCRRASQPGLYARLGQHAGREP